jgi:hypothetical protein
MTKPAQIYREMIEEEFSTLRPALAGISVTEWLQSAWELYRASQQQPEENRAARMVWAAVGLLAYGRTDHVEEMLKLIERFPKCTDYKACRYYVQGIKQLLPLPEELSPTQNPRETLKWFSDNAAKLLWDEEQGRVVLVADP